MKTKTLTLLLLVLAVLAGTGIFIARREAPQRSGGELGRPLLGELPANDIGSISIIGPSHKVYLVKGTERWVVENRFRYPADFSKIAGLVRTLKEMKIGRRFNSSDEVLKRLSLKAPDDTAVEVNEKGTRVELKDGNGKSLARILLGKTRKRGDAEGAADGQYVMLDNSAEIFLIDKYFSSFEGEAVAWLDKALVKVRAEDVKKVSCLAGDGSMERFTLERLEKGKDFEAVYLPVKGKIKKSALSRLAGALSSLRMDDVMDPSEASKFFGKEIAGRLDYYLFNGIIYRIFLGKACSSGGKCRLKLEVDYRRPPAEKEKEGGDKSPKKGTQGQQKTPEEWALEAKKQNARLNPWVFLIPRWKYNALLTDPNQLLEKPPQERDSGLEKG